MSETVTSATPRCPHFGVCGGCQHQDIAYPEQLRIKREAVEVLMHEAAVSVPEVEVHSAEPWEYRNRIRLRLKTADGVLKFGYNRVNTTEFMPIITCPISAPVLIRSAEALLQTAALDRDAQFWTNAASDVEFFCNEQAALVQFTLHCAPRTKALPGSFSRMLAAVQLAAPWITGASAIAADPRTGPTGRTLDMAGAAGLSYRVSDESYWISRGGFFQVNRFLVGTLVELVCKDRKGKLAWDLFSGVGLFSRVLAKSFDRVVAVEANTVAAQDLRSAFTKAASATEVVAATTLEFLQRAALDRDRPDLVVLDPPRAGAGVEACELIKRVSPQTIVYVSCDPATLARDLQVLTPAYAVKRIHLVDLFPQTVHIETVVLLERNS